MTKEKTADETVKNKNFVVPKEQAESEFETFADSIDLDTDIDAMDEDDQKPFKKLKSQFVTAMCKGRLALNERNCPEYTCIEEDSNTLFGKTLVFRKRKGSDTMTGLDGNKKNQNVRAMYKTIASLTGQPTALITNLAGRDIAMVEAIFTLLMA